MRIKAYLLLVATFFIFACRQSSNQQNRVAGGEKDTLERQQNATINEDTAIHTIENIQRVHADILQLLAKGALDSTTFKYDCSGEKSGVVSYYASKGKLKLIKHRYNEYSHYEAEDQYFVQHEKPFFVFKKGVAWSFDSGAEGATKDQVTEQRLYFIADSAVKCLEKTYEIRKHLGLNPDPAKIANRSQDCRKAKQTLKMVDQLIGYWKNKPRPGTVDCEL